MSATHEITIMFHSEIDPKELLKLVIEHGKLLEAEAQMQGRFSVFLEEEVSVESWGGRLAGVQLVGGGTESQEETC